MKRIGIAKLTDTFAFDGDKLVFTFSDGTACVPAEDEENGNYVYSVSLESGLTFELVLSFENVSYVKAQAEALMGTR